MVDFKDVVFIEINAEYRKTKIASIKEHCKWRNDFLESVDHPYFAEIVGDDIVLKPCIRNVKITGTWNAE